MARNAESLHISVCSVCGWVCHVLLQNGGFYYGPEQLTTSKAATLFSKLSEQHLPIGYTQLDPWAWKGYVATAEVRERYGSQTAAMLSLWRAISAVS